MADKGVIVHINVRSFVALVISLNPINHRCFHSQTTFPSLSVFTKRLLTSESGTQYQDMMCELGLANSANGGVDMELGRSPDVGHVP